jgi:hypothetical protein
MNPQLLRCRSAVASAILLLVALSPSALWGQTHEPPTLQISRVSTPPKLDDFVSGNIPSGYTKITDFRQREPGDGTPVSQGTTAYVGYDDRNFYAVFVCQQDPSALRANMTKREAIMGVDVVGLLLDTYHDRRRAYIFMVNPVGIQMDGITTEGQDDDYSFDTLWHSDGRPTPDGFVTWLAVPFKSLRFSNSPEQIWGFGLGRIIPKNNEISFWPATTRRIQSFGSQLATLEGLEHISPGRNLQFIPYAAGTTARYLDEDTAQVPTKTEGRIGLDSKVVLKDAITVDLTLNPDFSQVESDEPQVTINQRFEVFFPEKRPFFIENAGMFVTPENLFFSRRVVNPQFGARVTGKLGQWGVAGLLTDDRAPGQQIDQNDPLHGNRAYDAVVRVQREFAKQSHVGLMATTRGFGDNANTIVSLDTRLALNRNWALNGQAVISDTREADAPRRAGQDYKAGISYSSRAVYYESYYTDRSPDFVADLGYIPRVDVREAYTFGRYLWYPKEGRLLSFGPSCEGLLNWDYDGRLQDWYISPAFRFELPGSSTISFGGSRAYELFQGQGFDKYHLRASAGTEWLRWLGFGATYRFGQDVNYYPAADLAPFRGNSAELDLSLTLRPTSRFKLEETYIYNRLRTDGTGTPVSIPNDRDIFRLHLWRTKANVQFTRPLSLRAIIDYNAVLPDSALVSLTRDKRVTADVLLTYMLNPGTAVYVGYNDQYANIRVDPLLSPQLQPTGSPTTSIGRQFFVKVSYLLRF